MEDLLQYAIILLYGFMAGVINTLAGGGSLLTLPVLIFLGFPPNVANGRIELQLYSSFDWNSGISNERSYPIFHLIFT